MHFKVKDYWENRYAQGGNSGKGSYGEEALAKAKYINEVINHFNIMSIMEIGVGDGNNLALYENFNYYIGYDISETAIKICKEKFKDELYFFTTDKSILEFNTDLCLCLDVLFHQVEDDLYKETLELLFNNDFKYVLIYSYDSDNNEGMSEHMKLRKISKDIANINSKYKLINVSKGYDKDKKFLLYEKI